MSRATMLSGAPRQVHLEFAKPGRDCQRYDPLGAFETILEHAPLSSPNGETANLALSRR